MNCWSMIWGVLWPGETIPRDGYGQSMLDDIRSLARFQRASSRAMVWRAPNLEECRRYEAHPIIGRFGDFTYGIAEDDGRTWVARERAWYGWPDPLRYAVFALEPDGTIWCGRDVNTWPKAWTLTDK